MVSLRSRQVPWTLLATCLALSPGLLAQTPEERLATAGTLKEALAASGFDDAIRIPRGPNLDRKITSSAFGTDARTFVAAYYVTDELAGQGLGPLHVSVFDRARRSWSYKADVHEEVRKLGLTDGGAVLRVLVAPEAFIIETHFSPSAGFGIVLDRQTLKVATSISGVQMHLMKDRAVWYYANQVHFGDIHQDTLKMYDMARRQEVEIFPGRTVSPMAAAYRRQIEAAYARLPPNEHVVDVDRSLSSVVERGAGSLEMAVEYESVYLKNVVGADIPTLTTTARCDRASSGTWTCTERERLPGGR